MDENLLFFSNLCVKLFKIQWNLFMKDHSHKEPYVLRPPRGWDRIAQLFEHWVWCAADTGSSPQYSKGFFSQRRLSSADSLTYSVRTDPVCAVTCVNICAHVKNVAQLVEHPTGMPLRQLPFLVAARDFSPTVNFQCRLFYSLRTPPCATACVNICVHIKDPVVHVKRRRVQWIMEILKYPACTIGWVARLSQLAFPEESNQDFPWEELQWDNTDIK